MGSTEIRSQGSSVLNTALPIATNAGLVDNTDTGAAAATTEFLVEVGDAGEPKQIWITSIYANATTAGTLYFFEQDAAAAWAAFVAGNVDQVYALHVPVGGVGITDVNIGPITEDLSVCCLAGAYRDTNLGDIVITYDYV